MDVNILEYDDENEIVIEILGEGHTFTNVFREFISDVKEVDSAGYIKEHPFIEKTKLVVKAVPKKKIDKALRTACKDMAKGYDDFYKLLEKSV